MGASESAERDYLQDQAFWEHKAAVKAAAEERLRMSLYRSPGKVPTYREEVQLVEGQRTVHRAAAKLAEIESEARFQDEQMRRLEAMPEVERPWTIAALSITDEAADNARRRQHAAADDLNRSLITEGAQHRCEEQEREKATTRSATLQEESFFNRGAASEEWIAPERRVRHINVPAVRASHMPWLASQPSTPARARQVEVPADRISHMPWLASQPSTPAIARRVDVPANRISHMPWLGSEPSTPGSARRANAPAGRNSRAPWLPSEPSTPTAAKGTKAVRQQRDVAHMRAHSRPLWAWDAEPVQKSRR
ncbi:g4545 [Coccomyxa viridis]|uniref:G4545 protein n=1 Tax=Coccomyxa viridis TaxID=1274662 RepID=A0ABP1FQJ8_9CHLO